MALEISGKLIKILPEQTGTGKNGTWVKQEFVLETQEQYPKKICLSAWGDRVNDLKTFQLHEMIKANISIESREYNERWYTDVRAFRLEVEGGTQRAAAPQPAGLTPIADLPTFSEEDQDLPF